MKKKYQNIIVLIFTTITFLLLNTSCETSKEYNSTNFLSEYVSKNGTLIVAHRGYSKYAPENTISSFQAAIDAGAEACEFDVHKSKDDILVVIHDDSVDRTTNGNGKVNQLTYEYMSKLDAGSWKNEKYKGEKIPTLEETLTFLEKNNTIAVLEIKDADIVEEVIDMLYQTQMAESTVIISFNKSAVKKILKTDSNIPVQLLLKKSACMSGSTEDKVEGIKLYASKADVKSVGLFAFQLEKVNSDFIKTIEYNLKHGHNPGTLPLAIDRETLELLHKEDFFINTWTVDNSENIRELLSSNVDILTTNYVKNAIKIKEEINNTN